MNRLLDEYEAAVGSGLRSIRQRLTRSVSKLPECNRCNKLHLSRPWPTQARDKKTGAGKFRGKKRQRQVRNGRILCSLHSLEGGREGKKEGGEKERERWKLFATRVRRCQVARLDVDPLRRRCRRRRCPRLATRNLQQLKQHRLRRRRRRIADKRDGACLDLRTDNRCFSTFSSARRDRGGMLRSVPFSSFALFSWLAPNPEFCSQ